MPKPSIFSSLDFREARTAAKSQGKVLLLSFVSQHNPESKRMNAITWDDPGVIAWIKTNAIALQKNVEDEADLARTLRVSSVPTTLLINELSEERLMDWRVGFKKPDELLHWLEAFLKGNIDPLRTLYDSKVGRGGEEEVEIRQDMAAHLKDLGRFSESADELIWLWNNMVAESPHSESVRASFLVGDMRRLANLDPDVKTRFAKLRDVAENKSREDWIHLNEVVGDEVRTLQWFERIKNSKSRKSANELNKSDYLLIRLLKKHGRWSDIAFFFENPISSLKHRIFCFTMAKDVIKNSEIVSGRPYNPMRDDAATIYAALLAAGRLEEAVAVRMLALEFDDTPEMHEALDAAKKNASVSESNKD